MSIAVGLLGCNGSSPIDSTASTADENEAVLISTIAAGETEQTLFIDHYRSECIGILVKLCLLEFSPDTGKRLNFYNNIDRFDYVWGYTYELRVAVSEVKNPLQDASSLEHRLIEVVSSQRVAEDTEFEISLRYAPDYVNRISSERYDLYGEMQFTCIASDCDTLDSLLSQNLAIVVAFKHPSDTNDPLVLSRIVCSDALESFNESC